MRPQDIAVLLKILLSNNRDWKKNQLASELYLSPAEIGHSLNRSRLAGLIDADQKKVMKKYFEEFLFYGFRYVFPVRKGPIVIGTPTAYSSPVLKRFFFSDEAVVWADPTGDTKGEQVDPLYTGAVQASKKDEKFYESLCLLDALRIGRLREQSKAKELLIKSFKA